jgi:KDO2-lipid IV(A) lauroyltransferase
LARLAYEVLGRTPPGVGEAVGSWAGRLAYRLGWRSSVVEEQISRAYPDRDDRWVRQTARSAYEHVGREWLSVPYVTRRWPAEVERRVVIFEGADDAKAAFKEGKGLIVVSGHFGNWELAGSSLATLGMPVDAVMQELGNPRLNRFIMKTRNRNGMGLIDRRDGLAPMTRSLAAGRVVAFVADQDARTGGVFVPFFGRPASTARGPALLAVRTGAPFMAGGTHRIGPREYNSWLVRIEPPARGSMKDRVAELTARWVAEVERRARLYPEQYFWHHKRWKTVPPGTEPAVAGNRSREKSK